MPGWSDLEANCDVQVILLATDVPACDVHGARENVATCKMSVATTIAAARAPLPAMAPACRAAEGAARPWRLDGGVQGAAVWACRAAKGELGLDLWEVHGVIPVGLHASGSPELKCPRGETSEATESS